MCVKVLMNHLKMLLFNVVYRERKYIKEMLRLRVQRATSNSTEYIQIFLNAHFS